MSTESKEVGSSKLEEVIEETTTESTLLAELCNDSKSPAQEFQDRITLSKEWTISDGLMEGRIVGIPSEKELEEMGIEDKESVYLQYWMPILNKNETIIERFNKPTPWPPRDYKFAAIIEKLGYDSTSVEQAVGEKIVLEKSVNTVDETDWVIANPNDKGIHPSDHKNDSTNPKKDQKQISFGIINLILRKPSIQRIERISTVVFFLLLSTAVFGSLTEAITTMSEMAISYIDIFSPTVQPSGQEQLDETIITRLFDVATFIVPFMTFLMMYRIVRINKMLDKYEL